MSIDKGNCKKPGCKNPIPSHRINYCSQACYDEMKRIRSNKNYKKMKAFEDKIKSNDEILGFCYRMQQLKKPVFFDDLQKLNFDWGLSLDEIPGKDGTIWTCLIEYAYYVEPKSKSVSIWKMKNNQSEPL